MYYELAILQTKVWKLNRLPHGNSLIWRWPSWKSARSRTLSAFFSCYLKNLKSRDTELFHGTHGVPLLIPPILSMSLTISNVIFLAQVMRLQRIVNAMLHAKSCSCITTRFPVSEFWFNVITTLITSLFQYFFLVLFFLLRVRAFGLPCTKWLCLLFTIVPDVILADR